MKETEPDPLTEAAVKLSSTMTEMMSTQQSEHQSYANYVADRLAKLKSKKTVVLVRREMDRILDDALLAEMSD